MAGSKPKIGDSGWWDARETHGKEFTERQHKKGKGVKRWVSSRLDKPIKKYNIWMRELYYKWKWRKKR